MLIYTKSKFKLSAKTFILRKNTGTKKHLAVWTVTTGQNTYNSRKRKNIKSENGEEIINGAEFT